MDYPFFSSFIFQMGRAQPVLLVLPLPLSRLMPFPHSCLHSFCQQRPTILDTLTKYGLQGKVFGKGNVFSTFPFNEMLSFCWISRSLSLLLCNVPRFSFSLEPYLGFSSYIHSFKGLLKIFNNTYFLPLIPRECIFIFSYLCQDLFLTGRKTFALWNNFSFLENIGFKYLQSIVLNLSLFDTFSPPPSPSNQMVKTLNHVVIVGK